jgi:KipI family sensor histidine kinase inhibitor
VRVIAAGDTAIVVEFGERIDRLLSARVLQVARAVRIGQPLGVVEVVPTFRSLLVHYDPLVTSATSVAEAVRATMAAVGDPAVARRRRWTLPACYAAELAPDLAEVAERTGLPAETVAAQHAATAFHVYMVGFSPGHPYMGDLPGALTLPRRSDPRLRVAAGSIGIASTLSVIYPADSPSGWHIIGATPVRLFDPASDAPSLLAPGDIVRFAPVDLHVFQALRAAAAAGDYHPPCEEIAP